MSFLSGSTQKGAATQRNLPWFQRFADVAFRWQDSAPPGFNVIQPQQTAPVFAVVPAQQPAADGSVVLFTR